MAVPKRRQSRSRQAKRRAGHNKVKPVTLNRCSRCGQAVRRHVVCANCGYYRGRDVLKIEG